MSDKQTNSAEYYDSFNIEQVKKGINERIYSLYNRVLSLGFNSDSNILEIGCGPGKLTWLLAKKLKNGSIESTDISPKSVEFARSQIKHQNVTFTPSDALAYEAEGKNYDLILVFDVLEHIPEEQHTALFKKFAKWMNEDTSLLINIPNPNYILYARKHNPESLQEIDQPLILNKLSAAFLEAGLEIENFETYSIWAESDYQFMTVRKQKPFEEKMLHRSRSFKQKLKDRLIREWVKLRYRYPR